MVRAGDAERRFIVDILSLLAERFLLDAEPPREWSLFLGEILDELEPHALSVAVADDTIEFRLPVRERKAGRTGVIRLAVPCPLPSHLREPSAVSEVVSEFIAQLDEDVMGGTRKHLRWD